MQKRCPSAEDTFILWKKEIRNKGQGKMLTNNGWFFPMKKKDLIEWFSIFPMEKISYSTDDCVGNEHLRMIFFLFGKSFLAAEITFFSTGKSHPQQLSRFFSYQKMSSAATPMEKSLHRIRDKGKMYPCEKSPPLLPRKTLFRRKKSL